MMSAGKAPKQIFDAQAFINYMLATKNIRHRFYISYGAMSNIFAFLDAKDVSSFQCVSKFMYCRGVERVQLSI